MVSIYGQPEQCSEACHEILAIMQREATSANRGSVLMSCLRLYILQKISHCGNFLDKWLELGNHQLQFSFELGVCGVAGLILACIITQSVYY